MKNQRLSALENRFRIERDKFDALSMRVHLDETAVLPPDANYGEYSKADSYLLGTGRLLGNLNGKRVLEMGCGTGKLSVLLAKSGAIVFSP